MKHSSRCAKSIAGFILLFTLSITFQIALQTVESKKSAWESRVGNVIQWPRTLVTRGTTLTSLFSQPGGSMLVDNSSAADRNYRGVNSPMILGPFLLPTCTPPTGVIISEFRLRGPSGVNDEFVELYNNTDAALTICTADGSSGWAVASSDGTIRFVVPSNTTIPGRAHYLATGSTYSLSGYAASDLGYASDIPDNVGIALFNTATPANFSTTTRLDAVGFTSDANALYREGAGHDADRCGQCPIHSAAQSGDRYTR